MRVKVFSILVFTVLFAACGSGEEAPVDESRAEQAPSAVEAVRAERGFLVETIESAGLISGIKEAVVVSETTGIIEEVQFALGQKVSIGDLLVQVDDTIEKLNMEQAEHQYETAMIDLNAKEQSFESGNVSRAALIQARSTAGGAKAQYERAKKAYEDCSIRSPISGFIASKENTVSVGNYLTPGSRIARVVDLSELEVEIALGEGEIGLVEERAPAVVRVGSACEEGPFEAAVVAVAAGSDPATGSFAVVVRWPNDCGEKIKSGMSAEVTIEARNLEKQLLVPSSAIITEDNKTYVKTVENDVVKQTQVEVGRRRGNKTIINAGLNEGDLVILSRLTVLGEGDPVEPTIVEQ